MPSDILLQSGRSGGAELVGLLAFLFHIALVIWTLTDAQKNSSHPAFLWAIVVFFAPLVGIVLYFLLGRNE